jgi:SH3 domain-containing protein
MGQSELRSPSVLSPRVGHFVKGVANSNVKAETNNQLSGATEAALPITPERLELIKACAKRSARNADELAASRIAKRFAPQAPAKPVSSFDPLASLAPLTAPFVALASGIRTLTAVLIVAALLPNLTLAFFWLRAIDPPWSEVASLSPAQSPLPAARPAIPPPVLSAPGRLDASAGATVSFPIALDGTDGVPDRSIIVVRGLPPGSTLSDGYAHGDTEWRLKPDEIGDLHLVLAESATGESTLSVQLIAPDDNVITTTSTTLKTMTEPKADVGPYGVAEATQVLDAYAQGLEAGAEEKFAILDAAPLEAVPLPDRRPAPPATALADASWIKPTAYVNLRESPSSTAAVVSIVAKGSKLRVIGRKRGWVQVNNPTTSQSGWIYSSNLNAMR